jgi:hypothetical protein
MKMGLDITAFSGLKSVNAVYNHNGELVNPITRALVDVFIVHIANMADGEKN